MPQDSVATSCDPPLVSGRWRVGLRRAIASRRTVPADVKDQSYHPLHNSFQGNVGKVYPIPLPVSSGKCGFWKFAGVLIPRELRKQVRPVFALLSTANGIVGGAVRGMCAIMRRQDGGSPCGASEGRALPPFVVGSVLGTSNIAICDVTMSHPYAQAGGR